MFNHNAFIETKQFFLFVKIGDLENELTLEQRHHQETLKGINQNDRRVKDLAYQSEEDKKTQIRLQKTVEKLENKVKAYRRQMEETEEIAANNLIKYRQVQQELETANERADIAENTIARINAHKRSASSAPRGQSVQVIIFFYFLFFNENLCLFF